MPSRIRPLTGGRFPTSSLRPLLTPSPGPVVRHLSSVTGKKPTGMEAELSSSLAPLLTANGGKWMLANGGDALERTFRFKNFGKTWDFMTAVSLQCKIKNHHPEWSNVYNTTFIRWTTHSPRGLSAKDVSLAAVCDALAKDFGEVEEPTAAASGSSCEMKGLADRVVNSAGDCCTPKSGKS